MPVTRGAAGHGSLLAARRSAFLCGHPWRTAVDARRAPRLVPLPRAPADPLLLLSALALPGLPLLSGWAPAFFQLPDRIYPDGFTRQIIVIYILTLVLRGAIPPFADRVAHLF